MKKLLLSVTLITSLLITSETFDEKFAKLGSFEPIVTSTQSVGANSGMLNSLSTFSGWGGPVGTKNPFNYFEFNVDPWDKMNPITQVRVRILEKSSIGKVLIDELQNINLIAGGGSQKIKFSLPKPVKSSSNLYFEFYTNGRTGREETIPPFQLNPLGRYAVDKSITSLNMTEQTNALNPYIIFGMTSDTEFVPNISTKKQIDPHRDANWGDSKYCLWCCWNEIRIIL